MGYVNNYGFYTCFLTCYRTKISVSDGDFYESSDQVSDSWFHVVINYIVSDCGKGFTTYINGRAAMSDRSINEGFNTAGNGRIVIGRSFTEVNDFYTTMEMEELVIFNRFLTDEQINQIRNVARV